MDEFLRHYLLPNNASTCTSISTLNIRYRAHSGGDYQTNMRTDLGGISTPFSHPGIALITVAPQNAGVQLH